METNTYNFDTKNNFVQHTEKQLTKYSVLQSLLLGNELTSEEIPYIKEFKCVNEFFNSPLNDKKEMDFKKLFAAAIIFAKEKGFLPFDIPCSEEEIATLIDNGLTRAKVAFQQAAGLLDDEEAIESLIDRAAARLIAQIDNVVEVGLPIVAEKISEYLWAHPKTAWLAPIVETVLPYAAPYVSSAIKKGINEIAKASKKVVVNVVQIVKKVGPKLQTILNLN